jgi:hypothetical protein
MTYVVAELIYAFIYNCSVFTFTLAVPLVSIIDE